MMTISAAPAHYGFGAVVVTDINQAIATLQKLIAIIKDRNFASDLTDQTIVIVAGDVAGDTPTVVLSQNEAAEAEQAISVLAKDIQNKTGINFVQLTNAGAIPELRMGLPVGDVINQIRTLISTQRKATGAAKFPLSTTLLAILGVSVIGGLTVWTISKKSGGGRRRSRTHTGGRRSRRSR